LEVLPAAVVVAVALAAASTAGIANADPGTRVDTSSNPSPALQVGVDIAPGLWVGTAVKPGYPGNCSLVRFRTYPAQYTADEIAEMPMSDIETPLTYRITPGGAISFGRGCLWAQIAP
jgi:hypothetical protein